MLTALRHGRRPRLRSWQVDGFFAVLLVAAMVADAQNRVLVHGQRPNDAWMYVLIVAMALPYLAHRRWPMAALVVTSSIICIYSWAAYGPFPGLDAFLLLFGISLHSDRRRAAIAAAATAA